MKRSKTCRDENCSEAPMNGFDFCSRHISEPRRCVAVKRSTGERCQNGAVRGLVVCGSHGGNTPKSRLKSQRSKAVTAMQRFVEPYEGAADPISAFEAEYRRTLGRIKWYDEQLASLGSETDLIWGKTKEVHVGAGEYTGTDVTYEARVNILEELQRWERKHLLEMTKVWISAGLEERKLNIMRHAVEETYVRLVKALTALGLDPGDPHVRETLAEAFLGTSPTLTPEYAPDRAIPALTGPEEH